MKYDAVIFDLDGTLWDSREGIAASWGETLRTRYGADKVPSFDDITGIMGLTVNDIADRLLADYGDARYDVCRVCIDGENDYLRRHGAVIYDGVGDMLSALAATRRLFAVSNCQAGYIEAFFDQTGFGRFFADYETEGRTGLKKVDNIRLVMQRNGLHRGVYVGDTALDEHSAVAAGCDFIHAAYGFGTAEAPVGRIGAPMELPALLDALEAEE